MTQPPNPAPRRSQFVVIAMIAAGLIAGFTAWSYWRGVARRTFGPPSTPAPGSHAPGSAAGSAADAEKAALETKELQERFIQLMNLKGQVKDLLPDAQRLVERYPKDPSARTLLAQVHFEMGKPALAYEQLEMSLELDGQQPQVRQMAGDIALAMDRLDDAARHYAIAIGLEPRNATYRVHLAQVYMSQNEDERARKSLLEAIAVDSNAHRAYGMLCDLYARQNKLSLALPQIQKAIDNTPAKERATQAIYIRKKARLLRRDNQPEPALQTLNTLTAVERREPEVIEELASCWAMLNLPANGAQLYEQMLTLDPTDWRMAVGAADWRLKAGDLDAARQHISTLKRIDPNLKVIGELEARLTGSH
jgi:tetratricopeptide (TPR) repeat protein